MEWTSVKKGWVYQRKKHLLLPTSWSPKYLVLYSGPIPALAVYEQRSDAMPPYAPLLHIELAGEAVSVSTAHGSSGAGGWLSSALGSSRRGSVAAGLSRRSSFRGPSPAPSAEKSTKSYKERVLDEQGFMVVREGSSGQTALRLCFAVESREERDAWLHEIQRVVDQANRKMIQAAGANIFAMQPQVYEEQSVDRAMAALTVRSESEDLSIMCVGVTILDHSTVKRILLGADSALNGDEHEEEEIMTSQILDSSNSRHVPKGLLPEDLNLKFQTALDCKRRSDGDDKRRAELKLLKLGGVFSQAVCAKVRAAIDALHTTKSPLAQGTLHDDALCKIQLVADYQAGCADEEARAWLHQELLATRWVNGQDGVGVHCVLMAAVEYKGFRALGVLKLPVSAQTTLVFDMASDEEGGIVSESALTLMRDLARELRLIPAYPWRLGDGRTIQMALHPSVQMHHIQPHTMAPISGVMVVGRQAGKIQGGGGTVASAFTPPGFYLLNLGELLPMIPCANDVLRVARPELVRKAQSPVGTGLLHPEATLTALQPVLSGALATLSSDLEEQLELLPLDSADWTRLLHTRGINMSLLGVLAARATLPHVLEGLSIEMVGRTLKRALRTQLRQTVLHFREVQALLVEEELAGIAVGAINALLAAGPSEWKAQLLDAVEAAYGFRVEMDRLRGLPRLALFLAVQHHCGLQFRPDALLTVLEGSSLEPRHFVRFLPKIVGSYEAREDAAEGEDAALVALAGKVAVQSGCQSDLARAALARDFEGLAALSRDETFIRLARSTCPQSHALTASILLTELDMACAASGTVDVPKAVAVHTQARGIVRAHLGEHHPYQLVVAQRFTRLLHLRAGEGDREAMREALRVRQTVLHDSAKILGKSHACTKAQYREIGGLQLLLAEYDAAVESFKEALKHAQGIEAQTETALQLADAFRLKDDLEAALEQVRACQEALEKELPRMAGALEARARLAKMREDVLMRLARLSQAVAGQDDHGDADQMISGDMEHHLKTSICCYESLFELHRARADSPAEGEHLVALLLSIVNLKLKLAPSAARPFIRLATRTNTQSPVEDRLVHELVVKLLTGPQSPSAFMDKLLERAGASESMKEAEQDMRAVIQFTTST